MAGRNLLPFVLLAGGALVALVASGGGSEGGEDPADENWLDELVAAGKTVRVDGSNVIGRTIPPLSPSAEKAYALAALENQGGGDPIYSETYKGKVHDVYVQAYAPEPYGASELNAPEILVHVEQVEKGEPRKTYVDEMLVLYVGQGNAKAVTEAIKAAYAANADKQGRTDYFTLPF
jgi:hypothetical protein